MERIFVLTRTPDADVFSELTGGAFTFVEEGTANADNGYVLTTNGTPTLGTTAITFEQFSGAGQISAGAGLTKTGNTIDVVGTIDKITVSANALTIASTYVGQSSITTLGTITTGTWNGTAIVTTSGGTGLTSIAKGSVFNEPANTLSALDGGGSDDGVLFYTASSDTLSFATSIDYRNILISSHVGVASEPVDIKLKRSVIHTQIYRLLRIYLRDRICCQYI